VLTPVFASYLEKQKENNPNFTVFAKSARTKPARSEVEASYRTTWAKTFGLFGGTERYREL
jgi:hypothetical protein